VNGSVIPGMLGLEAGQSAFGDVYAWFKRLLLWPLQYATAEYKEQLTAEIDDVIIPKLAEEASAIEPNYGDAVSLDWMNGRRTPDANQALKGVISGINLGTDAPRIFKSLVEATCFGARKIAERFEEEGVEIKGVIALGGVAKKSTYVMQTLSDVMQMHIKIGKSEQTCALGAAMFAAVAAGKYTKVEEAVKNMGSGFEKTYYPNLERAEVYNALYTKYCELGHVIESITK
jgi:L-ribulokinase